MRIGNRDFQTNGHTYVMGILNVTPDSFSDGGRWNHMDDALFHAQRMIEEGADILDIGGESARPGYTRISDEEEISRVAPVIEALKKRFDTPLSVDTYKSGVASAAIAAGADLINDIWGLKADKKMAEVIAKAKLPSCLMHNRETMDYIKVCDNGLGIPLKDQSLIFNRLNVLQQSGEVEGAVLQVWSGPELCTAGDAGTWRQGRSGK